MNNQLGITKYLLLFFSYKLLLLYILQLARNNLAYYNLYYEIFHAIALSLFALLIFKREKITNQLLEYSFSYLNEKQGQFLGITLFILLCIFFIPIHHSATFVTYALFSPDELQKILSLEPKTPSLPFDQIVRSTFISPILTEIEFRFLLLLVLLQRFCSLLSVLIASCTYAIVQLDWTMLFYGFVLSFIFLRYGLVSAITAHAIFNLIQLTVHQNHYYHLFTELPLVTYFSAFAYLLLIYLILRFCFEYQHKNWRPFTLLKAGYS